MAAGDRRWTLSIDAAGAGSRLDVWIASQLSDLSRSRVQALIAAGRIRLGDDPGRASARVREGEIVTVEIPAATPAVPQPEDIPLTIVHEDDALIVVDKPAGLVVHPGAGRPSGTLVNALLHHARGLSGIGGVLRPGIVHRLDRGTSGLLVVAKDDATHRDLARQFAERKVEKEYLAVVLGVPEPGEGRITAPIGRDRLHRKRMSVRAPRGRAAASAYAILARLDGAALLRVRIESGRTHQIRVHLASIGHPVAGDGVYGRGRTGPCRRKGSLEALAALTRPALHAARLTFTHPATGRPVTFVSPLPPELDALVAALRD